MKSKFISNKGSQRLILIYAGWAMDDKPFVGLERPGYDIAVIWDYRDFLMDWSFIRSYKEVCLLAWSLGVFAASKTFTAYEHLLTKRIAINGTAFPVDRMLGIPPSVFRGTKSNLDERNLLKFYRRVCGSKAEYERFLENMPIRPVEELIDELDVFLQGFMLGSGRELNWDFALISSDDAIFPPVNQWRAWLRTPLRMNEGPHLPMFQTLIDRYIIDKDMMTSRFDRGLDSYNSQADVQYRVIERVARLIQGDIAEHTGRRGARVLEIGSGTGSLSNMLDRICEDAYIEMWDIAGEAPVIGSQRQFRQVDAETEIMHQPSKSFDMIISASTVQWFNSPVRFLQECFRVAAPGAYVLVTSFVRGNLENVAMSTGKSLPLLSADEWRKIIPAGFELKYMCQYNDEMVFDSALDAFRYLRLTGVDSLGRSGSSVNPVSAIRRFEPDLDGKFRLCYKPVIMLMHKR